MVFAKRTLAASVRFDEQPDGIYDKYLVCVTSSRTSDSYRLQNSCRPQGCRGYGWIQVAVPVVLVGCRTGVLILTHPLI